MVIYLKLNNFPDNLKVNCKFYCIFARAVGITFIFPQAMNLGDYLINLINKVDCITEVILVGWHIDDYYDPKPKALD